MPERRPRVPGPTPPSTSAAAAAAASSSRNRLDQPLAKARRWVPHTTMDPESFGAFAERFARFMGTARFLVYMTAFVILWLLWNTVAPGPVRFDPYAFIFLTLMLSLQASYAAPLILLAQNRQADRDKVQMEQDRARNERTLADTEFLTREVAALRLALREVATRDFVRSELRTLLEDLEERAEERGRRQRLVERADPPAATRGDPAGS
ncbi:DUF1003 domain-containing protein [Ornithinimicrobium cerasi]|uniref:Uncharacterized membrane protein n=1 Tax=Ornithinimicrobium cerasi TaxID=2248773 RepID=A0A285VNN1_9MICO|nr:DUF1003 domain-containing protein [Ornithinimicrobium cerasi]SOC55665.1 Uncharacterized membrane protein [Ornithinimicrobium cerasi]